MHKIAVFRSKTKIFGLKTPTLWRFLWRFFVVRGITAGIQRLFVSVSVCVCESTASLSIASQSIGSQMESQGFVNAL
jgi:hypothetical protein